MALPALRFLDVTTLEHEGQPAFCLRDQEGDVEDAVVLSPLAFFIASQLDGANDVGDIQATFEREFGGRAPRPEDIRKVVGFLDKQGLLRTRCFDDLRDRIDGAFQRSDTRPAYFAGKSYPDEPDALRAFLTAMFMREDGPRAVPQPGSGSGAPLPALVVPHIDFHRGGHTYAHGYLDMARRERPELVFVFGVAHASPPSPYVFTRKHFETPLGTIETDRAVMDRLEQVCDFDPYAFEAVQRTEHSIEFHAVMLAYLFGSAVRMAPILCGPIFDERGQVHPADAPQVQRVLDECRAIAKEYGGRATVIASADLAHVGRRFGDDFDVDRAILDAVQSRDSEDLDALTGRSPDAWYSSVMKDENARRVCGIHCVYATLKTIEGLSKEGALLHYDFAPDPAGGIVSFASVALR